MVDTDENTQELQGPTVANLVCQDCNKTWMKAVIQQQFDGSKSVIDPLSETMVNFAIRQDTNKTTFIEDTVDCLIKNEKALVSEPLCFDCFEEILDGVSEAEKHQLEKKHKLEKCIWDHFKSKAEQKVDKKKAKKPQVDQFAAQAELQKLKNEEEELDKQLAQMEKEEKQFNELAMQQLTLKKEEIDAQNRKEKLQLSKKEQSINENISDQTQLQIELSQKLKLAEKLQKTTFVNEVFEINVNEASICNFRLVYKQNIIQWPEVNAAFGQIAYLVTVLAQKFKCKFERHTVNYKGQFSQISLTGDRLTTFPLYYDEIETNKKQFTLGIQSLLNCIEQIKNKQPTMSKFKLPDRLEHEIQDQNKWNESCIALLIILQQMCLI